MKTRLAKQYASLPVSSATRGLVRALAVVVAMASAAPTAAHAGASGSGGRNAVSASTGSASVRGPAPAFMDKDRRECGQSCLYARANENISTQALYLIEKMNLIQSRVDADPDDAQVITALQGYCKSGENAAICFARYKEVQLANLRRYGYTLVKNSDSQLELQSPRGGGATAFADGVDQSTKKAQTPTVASFKDLAQRASDITFENERLNQFASPGFEEAIKRLPRAPSPEDFVKFKPIETGSGTQYEIEKDAKGNVVYDVAKFKAAQKKYETERKAQLEADFGIIAKETAQDAAEHRDTFGGRGKKYEDRVDPISRSAYARARKQVVFSANGSLLGAGAKSQIDFAGKAADAAGDTDGSDTGTGGREGATEVGAGGTSAGAAPSELAGLGVDGQRRPERGQTSPANKTGAQAQTTSTTPGARGAIDPRQLRESPPLKPGDVAARRAPKPLFPGARTAFIGEKGARAHRGGAPGGEGPSAREASDAEVEAASYPTDDATVPGGREPAMTTTPSGLSEADAKAETARVLNPQPGTDVKDVNLIYDPDGLRDTIDQMAADSASGGTGTQ